MGQIEIAGPMNGLEVETPIHTMAASTASTPLIDPSKDFPNS